MRVADMNVGRVLERRSRWLELAESWDQIGQQVTETGLRDYAVLLARSCRALASQESVRAIILSLSNRIGSVWDGEDLRGDLLRLAGNVHRLAFGEPVPPWNGQGERELVPVQILEARRCYRRQERGAIFRMRYFGGLPCGLFAQRYWSSRFCHVLSRRLGFTSQRGARPFHSPLELVGMRLAVVVDPEGSRRVPMFQEIPERQPAGLLRWNRELYGRRNRLGPKGEKCPLELPTELPCWRCPAGQDVCAIAVRCLSYVERHCQRCGEKRWHDQSHPRWCVECQGSMEWQSSST